MNIIDPRLRKTVIIDGAAFVLRPLNGADRIEIGSEPAGRKAQMIARKAIVSATGTPYEWDKVMTADDLPPTVITKIALESMALSGISGDDEKNSQSGRESSSDKSPTPGKSESSNTAKSESDASPANVPALSPVT